MLIVRPVIFLTSVDGLGIFSWQWEIVMTMIPMELNTRPMEPSSKIHLKLVMVVHICNPIYSGDGDLEDCSLRPVRAQLGRLYLRKKKYKNKRIGVIAQEVKHCLACVRPGFSLQYHPSKKIYLRTQYQNS
jgi:hypothetical protein